MLVQDELDSGSSSTHPPTRSCSHRHTDMAPVIRAPVRYHLLGICHLTRWSQSFTKQWQPLCPFSLSLLADHFSPCPLALSIYTWRSQPADGHEGLKGSFGFIFVHFAVRLWSVMVAPQQDWPCGSNALTAHKQRQGLQMTTCHRPGSIICSSPSPLNRCLGCHRLWGLPYGEVYNKTKTINLSVSGTASPAAPAATFEQRQNAGCVGRVREGGRAGASEDGWERSNEREALWH